MYCNPNNIINTLIKLLENNRESIDYVVKKYMGSKHQGISIFKGMQKTLPDSAFPSLELEPGSESNEWYATRTQMIQFPVTMTLTMLCPKKELEIEYAGILTTIIKDILSDPKNLQLPVDNEYIWDINYGKQQLYLLDAFVDSTEPMSAREGTMRVSTISWWGKALQQFPENRWAAREGSIIDVT